MKHERAGVAVAILPSKGRLKHQRVLSVCSQRGVGGSPNVGLDPLPLPVKAAVAGASISAISPVVTSRWLDPSHGGVNLGFPVNS
jgi:hypothetical protein